MNHLHRPGGHEHNERSGMARESRPMPRASRRRTPPYVDRLCHGTGCKKLVEASHTLSCTHVGMHNHTHSVMLHQAVGLVLSSTRVPFGVNGSTLLTGRLQMDVFTHTDDVNHRLERRKAMDLRHHHRQSYLQQAPGHARPAQRTCPCQTETPQGENMSGIC